jgi:membrane associated rhomboid family serine protease
MIPIKDDNPTKTFPLITISLIVINIIVFFKYNLPRNYHELEYLFYGYGLIPAKLFKFGILDNLKPLFTHMFFHGDIIHLSGNMLYLWIFGNNIEDELGKIRFIIFYFCCGWAAAFLQVAMNPTATVPMIGASGAIAGILGAYVLLFPHAKVLIVFPVFIFLYFFWVPAIFILMCWFLIQIVNGYLFSAFFMAAGGVAWFAHIGGFVAGATIIYPMLLTKYKPKKLKRYL